MSARRRISKRQRRNVERLTRKSIGGIVIFVAGLVVLAAVIIYFAPDLLQSIKARP